MFGCSSQFCGPSVINCSCRCRFSSSIRSFRWSQLSVGLWSSVYLYSCNCGRNSERPPIGAVLRSPGAWSEGGTHLRGGRGAKRARRFGGSLSVMAAVYLWITLLLMRVCWSEEEISRKHSSLPSTAAWSALAWYHVISTTRTFKLHCTTRLS